MELPSHPRDHDTGAEPEPATTVSWASRLVIAAVVALLLAIVVLHLTGVVGPAAH